MEKVFQKLESGQPDKLFTVGGGCDADFTSIAYMNQKHNGNLKILYFDAHGDINSPEESESKLFYGMPLRCLMKDLDSCVFPFIRYDIKPDQIIHIGARELDDAEVQFMNKNCIFRITVDELEMGAFEKIDRHTGDYKEKQHYVGMGIFEYKSCGKENKLLNDLIQYGIDF